jgi:hypothetical protein
MLGREQLVASFAHEIAIIKHLATKVPQGGYSFRPTPGQRTTLELMQYLTTCAIVPALRMTKGNWDDSEALEKEAESVTADTFAAAMDRQLRLLTEAIRGCTTEKLVSGAAEMPWGQPCTVGEGLVNAALKAITAYRMQFFLYLKAAGRTDLGPANCWVGRDPRPKAPVPPAA